MKIGLSVKVTRTSDCPVVSFGKRGFRSSGTLFSVGDDWLSLLVTSTTRATRSIGTVSFRNFESN